MGKYYQRELGQHRLRPCTTGGGLIVRAEWSHTDPAKSSCINVCFATKDAEFSIVGLDAAGLRHLGNAVRHDGHNSISIIDNENEDSFNVDTKTADNGDHTLIIYGGCLSWQHTVLHADRASIANVIERWADQFIKRFDK